MKTNYTQGQSTVRDVLAKKFAAEETLAASAVAASPK